MALVSVADVQSWITDDRLQLELTDSLVEEPHISEEVTSKCSTRYDVSGWTDRSGTPVLIRSIISARVAAVRYRKVYADQIEGEFEYSDWLEQWANDNLDKVLDGTLPLTDVPQDELDSAQQAASASFYPTDTDDVKFTMDMNF